LENHDEHGDVVHRSPAIRNVSQSLGSVLRRHALLKYVGSDVGGLVVGDNVPKSVAREDEKVEVVCIKELRI